MKPKKLHLSTKKSSVKKSKKAYTKDMKNTLTNSFAGFKLLSNKHAGKWVAISPDQKKVLGYSENLSTLQKKVRNDKVIFTKGLSKDAFHCF